MCDNARPVKGVVLAAVTTKALPEFDMMNLKLRRFRARLGRAKKPPPGLPTQLAKYNIKPVVQLGKGVSRGGKKEIAVARCILHVLACAPGWACISAHVVQHSCGLNEKEAAF